MIYNNTVYISMSKMTMGDFLKIAEKKLEKKIKNIKKLDKYELHPSESDIYPNSKECEYKQIVWISKEECFQINYINFEKFKEIGKKIENLRIKEYIFQKYNENWENLCRIEINFKKEQIMFALDILTNMGYEVQTSKKENLLFFVEKDILAIYPIEDNDRVWDSLGESFIKIEEDKIIEALEKNIKDNMKINIICMDYDSMFGISTLGFYYECYYYDNYVLFDIEQKRIENNKKNLN